MSDHESSHDHQDHSVHDLSPSHSHATMRTTALHDHRHQADSLPIRQGSFSHLPPPAVPGGFAVGDADRRRDDASVSPTTKPAPIKSPKSSVSGISRTESLKEPTFRKKRAQSFGEYRKRLSKGAEALSPLLHPLSKTYSKSSFNPTFENDVNDFSRHRRVTRSSMNDSDVDSHGSRESKETEKDVCFPMRPDHIKVNGIDFDEINEFIEESRQESIRIRKEQEFTTSSSEISSAAAAKYTPKLASDDEAPGVSFGVNRVEGQSSAPNRFSFFHSESEETSHAPDLESLVTPGQSIQDLFRNGEPTWWLDCSCPTDAEMKVLSKAFGMHPLTTEDIRMQETREKVELFRSYYFVCFHTFESDSESEDFLEPVNVYMVVFKNGILSFHFNPISHAINVRRRFRQLRDYVAVSADWLCYAIIDDITDSFAPIIQGIEYEADAIEDQVFLAREMDLPHMLQRIGESRRKVMTLMRLLSGKADVIKMFAKRCQDEVQGHPNNLTSANLTHLAAQQSHEQYSDHDDPHASTQSMYPRAGQPRADIALYLGDIQDHIVTMQQSLSNYEKLFSRSHSNYLAQLQVESFFANLKVTEMLSQVTILGTILVPLNLISGMFGMNVEVPGQKVEGLGPFFGIFGFILVLVISFSCAANWFIKRGQRTLEQEGTFSEGLSLKNWRRKRQQRQTENRSRELRSIVSVPRSLN